MARYQAAIDVGGDLQEIIRWINAAKAERLAAEAMLRGRSHAPARLTRAEIAALVHRTASVTAALRTADMQDKADLHKGLNLRLTYEHGTRIIRAEAQLGECPFWVKVRVRGGSAPNSQCLLTGVFALGSAG